MATAMSKYPEYPPSAAARDRQGGRTQDGQPADGQHEQAATAGPDGVRPVVARHSPHGVIRILEGLRHSQPAVERSHDPHDEADRSAAQALRPGQVPADNRKLVHGRCEHLVLQPRVTSQHEAEDRREQQQQREQRNEPVVGEQRGQIGAKVVEVLVGHREREARPVVFPLKTV
jgi:hypothetical protein